MWEKLKSLYNTIAGTGSTEQSLPDNAYTENDPNLTKVSGEQGISWQSKRRKWLVQVKDQGVRRTIGRQFLYEDAVALKRAWEELINLEVLIK